MHSNFGFSVLCFCFLDIMHTFLQTKLYILKYYFYSKFSLDFQILKNSCLRCYIIRSRISLQYIDFYCQVNFLFRSQYKIFPEISTWRSIFLNYMSIYFKNHCHWQLGFFVCFFLVWIHFLKNVMQNTEMYEFEDWMRSLRLIFVKQFSYFYEQILFMKAQIYYKMLFFVWHFLLCNISLVKKSPSYLVYFLIFSYYLIHWNLLSTF